MKTRQICAVLVGVFLIGGAGGAAIAGEKDLKDNFIQPPGSARPWVYWTWLSGNLTRAGITADLEAMKRVGIGGALILDVDQGTPHGPMKFLDDQWLSMFKHTIAEAKRLGMEINVNNGQGYYGSGGPWVTHEKAMQSVVQSETHIKGGAVWTGVLPKARNGSDYRDIAVLAVPEPARPEKDRFKIADFEMKSLNWSGWVAYRGTQSAPLDAAAPPEACIPLAQVVDLTSRMNGDGHISWNAPAGEWTLLRIGHAYNGHVIGPAPKGEGGPETNKLDQSATDLHFNALVKRLNEAAGPAGHDALVATHIDSWEGGGQNWTPRMREEFRKRRGYDLLPYLPILSGRVVGELQTTERFLWDIRKTVSELMVENYAAEFQKLAHRNGLRLTFESYTTIANDLDVANYVDEPMAEFWTPNGQGLDFGPTTKSMSSAAHLNGHALVGAESFTSGSSEKWLWHPAMLKRIGDQAFCDGVNRFVFHRYAAQPFEGPPPGLQMGPWGLHYERTNTWWDWTGPWHTYLARCQQLLRQGEFVADVLNLQPEEPLYRFQKLPLKGYDYDACGPDAFERVTEKDGKLTFPIGRQYRLLALTHTGTMTLPMLQKIRDLVTQGAAVLGNPPQATPGLTDFPGADAELKKLVTELWGTDAPVAERTVGKGKIFCGISPEEALTRLGTTPDFTCDIPVVHYIHHTIDTADCYFVANEGDAAVIAQCAFRVTGKQPELWDAETGRITPITAYANAEKGITRISLPLEPSASAFIMFRPDSTTPPANARITDVTRDGQPLMHDGLAITTAHAGAAETEVAKDDAAQPALNLIAREIHQAGTYRFTTTDGRTQEVVVPSAPAMVNIDGPWVVRFPQGSGAPPEIKLNELISLSQHPEAGVKYFSGMATYVKTIAIAPELIGTGNRIYLDLGKVNVMARVKLNGKDLGILWKPPYQVDITSAAKAGGNDLEIAVINLWPNRLIGDEQLPEDSQRNSNGTLKAWPQWLLDGKPSPAGRITFSSWRLWKKNEALPESGLIGPVQLRGAKEIPPLSLQ